MVHLLVLTVGAGLGVFQPIRNEAAGYSVQPDDGRHLQGAGQIPQQGETLPPSHLGLRLDSRDLREVPEVVLGRSQAFLGFLSGVCETLSMVLDGLKCFRGPLWGSRHL